MKSASKVTINLTQKELEILKNAVCDYQGWIGALIAQMTGMGMSISKEQALSKRLDKLSRKICDLMVK